MKTFLCLLFLPFALFSFEPRIVTPYPVLGYREIPFHDEQQKVDREVLVWYPVAPDVTGIPSSSPWDVFNVANKAALADPKIKKNVIVVSHGYTGNPHQLSWFIRGLVHQGFIVLAIQHRDLVDGKAHVNHWQRAQDVGNVIAQFSKSSMAAFADLSKIGVAGYSLGGTTAIWVIGGRSTKTETLIPTTEFASPEDYTKSDEALPTLNKEMMAKDWRDPRIKAAFIMAPAWAWVFNEESLKKVTVPTYIIASEGDEVLVSRNNAGFFARNIPHSFYQLIAGKGGHFIFVSVISDAQRRKADPDGSLQVLFKDDVSIDRGWIQSQLVEQAIGFFDAFL